MTPCSSILQTCPERLSWTLSTVPRLSSPTGGARTSSRCRRTLLVWTTPKAALEQRISDLICRPRNGEVSEVLECMRAR
jgi:hypothetical protein